MELKNKRSMDSLIVNLNSKNFLPHIKIGNKTETRYFYPTKRQWKRLQKFLNDNLEEK